MKSHLMKKSYCLAILIVVLSFVALTASVSDVLAGTVGPGSGQPSGKQTKGFAVFSENCAVCHTLGVGDAAVPDLKGVTLRRAEAWLKSFIQSPSKMIAAKEPIAMELLAKYKEPMDDPGLTSEDVDAVVEYLKEADAETKSPQEPAATPSAVIKKTATRAEIERGKTLFQGEQRFFHGGASCMSCHDIRSAVIVTGGRLAKELETSYSRLGEARMRAVIEKPPFPVMREAYQENPLTEDEIADLVAFLEQADKEQGDEPQKHYGAVMLFAGMGGFIGLLCFYSVFWSNRRRRSVNQDVYDRRT